METTPWTTRHIAFRRFTDAFITLYNYDHSNYSHHYTAVTKSLTIDWSRPARTNPGYIDHMSTSTTQGQQWQLKVNWPHGVDSDQPTMATCSPVTSHGENCDHPRWNWVNLDYLGQHGSLVNTNDSRSTVTTGSTTQGQRHFALIWWRRIYVWRENSRSKPILFTVVLKVNLNDSHDFMLNYLMEEPFICKQKTWSSIRK